jgi:hypothetical protein
MTDVYTRTVTIHRDQIPAELIDMLKMSDGLPPHDGFSFVRGDSCFYNSIKRKYSDDMISAARALVITPMKAELERAKAEIASRY